jgi:hypothetical protein
MVIIDADTMVHKACWIAEKTVYDILPLELQGVPSDQVIDAEDYDSYKQFVIQSFELVKQYDEWLEKLGKRKQDFLRISRKEIAPVSHALHTLDGMIKDVVRVTEPEQLIVLLTGDNNFRDTTAKLRPYKENRRDKEKPVHFEAARNFLINKWNATVIDGCEADDMCGILATACEADAEPFIIASVDKDLKSIPGLHYNYDKRLWYSISVREAETWFWVQALAGDSTDCIPGLDRVGEVGAKKILGKARSYKSQYAKARAAYRKAFDKDRKTTNQKYAGYKTADELLIEQATLVHMQRWVGEMWEPPK